MTETSPRTISLLTGAGFSRNIFPEMPTIEDLTSLVLEDEDINLSLKQASMHPSLFAPDKGLQNIETWLQVIEESAAYISDYAKSLQRKALILTIERKIVEIISTKCASIEFSKEQLSDFEFLIKAKINVLTTNYDLLFELATQELIGAKNLNDVTYAYDLNAGLFDLGHMRKNSAYLGSSDSGKFELSKLFKLHGSCDWYSFDTSSDDRMYINTTKLRNFPYKGFESVTKENLKNMSPVIAPPTANKRQQIHSTALKSIWSSAFAALQETKALILFGTALHETDASLTALLIEGTPENIPIYIFDKNKIAVENRVKKLFKNPRITTFDKPELSKLSELIGELKSPH